MTPIRFAVCDPEEQPAAGLLAAMKVELNDAYESPGRLDSPPLLPEELRPPGGAYLVGFEGRQAVGGGGLRRLDDGVAEIKRMYVVPAFRSRGVARALLAALEENAGALGYAVIRLDTGPKQVHALSLYRSVGYGDIAPYNDNPFACFWGEKALRSQTQ